MIHARRLLAIVLFAAPLASYPSDADPRRILMMTATDGGVEADSRTATPDARQIGASGD